MNWFVSYEIQRGITNNYHGRVKILDDENFFKEIKVNFIDAKGIILMNPKDEWLQYLSKQNIPYIVINQQQKANMDKNAVNWDQLNGVYEAMSYLVNDLYHKNIGLITRGLKPHQDRIAGYQISLRSFNIPYCEELVVRTTDSTEKDGYKAMNCLLKLKPKPTAVFVDTDIKAIGAIEAVKDFGLKVPADISIIGFDNIPEIKKINPALTTVGVPYYEMGVEAVRLLWEKIKTSKVNIPSKTLKTKLIIRHSCAKRLEEGR